MGRPRVALLDRDKIAAAALELVDRDGDFTMPGLAQHLGVRVSSIYHHVPGGRSEVVELVRVLVTNRIDGSAFDSLPWDEAFAAWAQSYLDAFSTHPAAIRLLATEPVRDPSLVAVYSSAASGLRRAGFREEQIIAVITAAESFFLGAALDSVAPDVMVAAGDDDAAADLRRALAAVPSSPRRAQQAFELGVGILVEGLRAMLADIAPATEPAAEVCSIAEARQTRSKI
jgi:AcrR family transcriptional regulator